MKKGMVINFDEIEKNEIVNISHSMKKTQTAIVREAVNNYISSFKKGPKNLKEAVKDMAGMFKNSKIDNVREESNKGLERGMKL